jgi:integrase/recombinase XerD
MTSYTGRSAVNELRQVARFSRWLGNRGLGARDLSRERIEEFLAFQRRSGRLRSQSRPGLLCLLGVLQARGVAVGPPAPLPSARELLLSSFERYLLVERGLAAGTVVGYLAHAERFLASLPAGGLPEISAAEVSQAVLRVSASVAAATAQDFISGLRAFPGFLFLESFAGTGLSQAALAVQRRRSPLPRGLARSEIQAILNSCDRRSALGRRDYAIVILLVRLGLRRAEVAALRLDDIDWRAGELVSRFHPASPERAICDEARRFLAR